MRDHWMMRAAVRSFMVVWLCLAVDFAQADPNVSLVVSPVPNGTNFNVFAFTTVVISITNGTVSYSDSVGLLSITNATENLPFTILEQTSSQALYQFRIVVPLDVLSKTYTLTWTNYTTGSYYVDSVSTGPVFGVMPQNQSALVGSTVSLTAQAFHTSGYQWQQNGTNLVDDGHFLGVTNATLTIANVRLSDAGDYTVIANNPAGPASTDATLSVYKPILLGLTPLPAGTGFELSVANQDRSPFEPERIPNLTVLSTTDLTSPPGDWNAEAVSGTVSNGVLFLDYPYDGSSAKFWRVMEQ
jgi:hypothetical protein